MIKFGYKASAEQFGPVELLRFAMIAEDCGFDSAFISDHFQPWRHEGGHAPASLTWLGAAAARTRRIVLGTSVLTPTFRYHPSMIAQAFATLGAMFPGRIVLGVGTGESLNEVPATGMAWPEAKGFAHDVCLQMARENPELYLIKMAKNQRNGRIFLDYLRNDRMATAVAPLSPRARPGATVSMPLTWAQVKTDLDPKRFTLRTVPALLKKSTAWKDYGEGHRLLEQAIKRLARSMRRAA